MTMKVGDLVRHTARLEWGVGVLVVVDATRYTINFEHRDQAILTIAAASKWLETVDPATVPSDSALRDPDRWSELELAPEHRHKKSGGRAKVPCAHCHKPLNNGQYSKDRKLKSCPQCSVEDGTQHVFYPCPDGFGRSEERVTDGNPDGDQSYCYKCRGREMSEKPVSCAAVTQ
jgi:hypothetical protein